jgi:hypothetical protein
MVMHSMRRDIEATTNGSASELKPGLAPVA